MKINKGPEHTKAILKPALTINTGLPFRGLELPALPRAHRDLTWPEALVAAAGPGGLVGRGEGLLRGVGGK